MYVYVAECAELHMIKIGFSLNPEKRVKTVYNSLPPRLDGSCRTRVISTQLVRPPAIDSKHRHSALKTGTTTTENDWSYKLVCVNCRFKVGD